MYFLRFSWAVLAVLTGLYSCCYSLLCVYTFTISEEYSNKKANDVPRLSIKFGSGTECVAFCTNAGVDRAVMYDPATSLCSCYHRSFSAMTYSYANGVLAYLGQTNEFIQSWITNIISFSSYYVENNRYPATSMLGAPNFYPQYGDTTLAWCPAHKNAHQFIELRISEPIFITEIHIYETYFGGAVEVVSIRDPDSNWVEVWRTPGIQLIRSSRIFIPTLKDFKSDSVRLDLDLATKNEWSEFDAVKVIGTKINKRTRTSLV